MAIQKSFLKSRPSCKVKFLVTDGPTAGASRIYLVGDFNSWNKTSHPMKKRKDGMFYIEIELGLGQDYQFRYLSDKGEWFNDSEADAFVPCAYSSAENFLIKA